jgi:hypothetical protein
MSSDKPKAPRTILREFLYDVATTNCPDVALAAVEAQDFAERFDDTHKAYWAGYTDCARALSESLTKKSDKDVREAIERIARNEKELLPPEETCPYGQLDVEPHP